MTSYNPPKKNAAFVMYVGLRSQADTKVFQVNPTLASGDVKVSKDGGATANVTTLPTVISSSAIVKLELSSTEMNADNVTVLWSDAAGGQWCDLIINLQTAANQFDDLALASALSTVAGYLDTEVAAILAAVDTEVAAIKAKTDNLPSDPADDSDIDAQLATIAAYLDTEVAAILAAVDTAVAAIKAKTDNLPSDPADDSDIDAQLATIAGYLDTEIAAIKAKTDLIPASPAAVGSAMTLASGAVSAAALATDAAEEIADTIFKRDWTAITGEASRSLLNALRFLRNKWTVVGTTLTVMEEDDSTTAWTATVTKDASSDPVTGSDPT